MMVYRRGFSATQTHEPRPRCHLAAPILESAPILNAERLDANRKANVRARRVALRNKQPTATRAIGCKRFLRLRVLPVVANASSSFWMAV
jgi:hypothetical protein